MIVKNYYKLSPKKLGKAILEIRAWLARYPHSKFKARAEFAMEVALCAHRLEKKDRVGLVKWIINNMCEPLDKSIIV